MKYNRPLNPKPNPPETNQMKTLIIIPAYNESESIEIVVNNLTANYPQYDYVVVNDGSKDKTAEICLNNNYNMIDLPVNIGLSGGVQSGMKYAYRNDYDYAIQFDGDGQHDPQYISRMLEEIEENNLDFVIGSRFIAEKKTYSLRMIGSNIIQLVIKITTGKTIKDPTSGMRMYNRKLIEIMANSLDFGPEPDTIALLLRSGAKFKEIPVTMNNRIAGVSYLNAASSIVYMARIVTSLVFMQWFRKKPNF